MRLISSVKLILKIYALRDTEHGPEPNECFVSKVKIARTVFFSFVNALLFLWLTRKERHKREHIPSASHFHFESEKPYFCMAGSFVCMLCQRHLVFAVNLHQIVCLRPLKKKSFHFYSDGRNNFCCCCFCFAVPLVCRRSLVRLLLLLLLLIFFIRYHYRGRK